MTIQGITEHDIAEYLAAKQAFFDSGRIGKVGHVRTWWHGQNPRALNPALDRRPDGLDWASQPDPFRSFAGAPRILLPSILATLTTLGLFGWFGVPINLFTMLALWLVLGWPLWVPITRKPSTSPVASPRRAARRTVRLDPRKRACRAGPRQRRDAAGSGRAPA